MDLDRLLKQFQSMQVENSFNSATALQPKQDLQATGSQLANELIRAGRDAEGNKVRAQLLALRQLQGK
jgi:hypothetical protein